MRSARTRLAIVDALRELNNEGNLRPTASQVAERAGVSRRTVWQHFVDLESLFAEAGRRDYEVAMTFIVPVDLAAPLEQRIAELVEQRARLYEAVTPVWRAGRLHQPFSAQMRRNSDQLQQTGLEQLQRVFARELTAVPVGRRRAVSSALQVATGWSTWDSLRTDLGLAAPEAGAAVVALVQGLLQAT